MTLFRDKYRVESSRLTDWNYASDGGYFVTICTQNRKEYFGEVRHEIMGLNETGCTAIRIFKEIPNQFSNVKLDQWIVMPNHVHAILFLENTNFADGNADETTRRDRINPVSTRSSHIKIFSKNAGRFIQIPQIMGTKSLGEIIRWFKGRTTYEIHRMKYPDFGWQEKFYDRIIQNENELNRIRQYILDNPKNWEKDRNKHPFDLYI